jgi:hypothetical protein
MAMSRIIKRYVQDSLKELEQLLKDVGDCDHPVNICCCGLKRIIEDGQQIIRGAK